MVASRNKPEGGLRTSLWLGVLMLLALPSEVGYQDLATLLTRQPVVNRAQKTAFASTFGTIHEAPYNLPEPVGASIPIPPGYTLAGLDAGHADVTASLRDRLFGAERDFSANPYAGPVIDRTRKGDYGVAAKDDRRVALKGDRLKVRPAGEAVPGDRRAGARIGSKSRSKARRWRNSHRRHRRWCRSRRRRLPPRSPARRRRSRRSRNRRNLPSQAATRSQAPATIAPSTLVRSRPT